MADFKISLGVDVQVGDIQSQINSAAQNLKPIKLDVELGDIKKELGSLNTELKNIGKSIGTLDSGGGMKSLLSSINKISDALEGVTAQFNGLTGKNGVKGAAQAAQQAARQTDKIISDSANRAIKMVSSKGIEIPFNVLEEDSQNFEKEVQNFVKQWTKGKGELVGVAVKTVSRYDKDLKENVEKISEAQVKYRYGNVTRQRTIREGQIGEDDKGNAITGFVEVAGSYKKVVEKTKTQTNNFVRQQKKAVGDLTNQINQLDRDARDKNANRPIKEQGHLDQLKGKYNEITAAIQRMGSASSSTFDDERNNVNRLISEYKSMKSEFKNAENVAGRLSGDDYESGRKTAEQRFESLKIKAANYAEMSETVGKLQTAFNKVGDASSLKDFTSQLRVAEAELAKVKVQVNATSQNDILGINKSSLKSDIESLQKANPNIDKFKAKIGEAEVSVKDLLNELGQVKNKDSFGVVSKRFTEFTKQAKDAGVIAKNAVTQAEQVSKIQERLQDTGFDGYIEQTKRAREELKAFDESSEKVQSALTRLDNAKKSMDEANEAQDWNKLVEASKEYEAALKRVNSLKKQYQKEERIGYDQHSLDLDKTKALLRLESLFESGSQAAKKYGSEIERLRKAIDDCADSEDIRNVNKEIDIVDSEADILGLRRDTFTGRLKKQFQKYSQYLSIASIMMEAWQAARDMFEQVKLIDTAMTELKKVTNETDASYDKFLSNAASRAKEIGTTIDGLVTSTADFARLGYDFEQSAGLAEVANIYTVVGDEIEGVEDATQSLVSTLAAFKHEMGDMSDSDFAMSIVDKFNEVSNNFAISSGGIGEALQRSASSLATANNTLDESIALITAANEVTQNPEKVGNAMKTKFLNCLNVQKCA